MEGLAGDARWNAWLATAILEKREEWARSAASKKQTLSS